MVICPRSSHMRYKRSLLPYQILASFICQIRSLTCSNILKILSDKPEPPLIYDSKVLDGAVIVHSLPTTSISTFHEYADRLFIPYLDKQLGATSKLDVVWDRYIPDSLKESTREKKGESVRRKVSGETKLPGSWIDFLRDPMNKQALFDFLLSRLRNSTGHPPKLYMSHQAKLCYSNVPASLCKTAIKRRRIPGLWFII